MNKEELLKALNVIKRACIEKNHCFECPMSWGEENMCYLQDVMSEKWRIINYKEEKWKAFYD